MSRPILALSLPSLLVVAALAALAPVGARADDGPAAMPDLSEAERVVQRYLSLKMMGRHSGGIGIRMGTFADGRILLDSRTVIKMTRRTPTGNETMTTEDRDVALLDAQGKVLTAESVTTEAGVEEKVTATYGAMHVDLVHEGPGGTYSKRLEIPEDYSTDYRVFLELKKDFVNGQALHRRYHDLDPSDQRFEPQDFWLLEKTTYERDGTAIPAWRIRMKDEDVVAVGIVDDEFLPFETSAMDGFVTMKWVDEPPFDVAGGGWSVSIMVDVDRALPYPFRLEELEVRMVLDPPPAADSEPLLEDDPYQTVVREETGYHLVLHHGRLPDGFEPVAFPVETEDADVRRFLEPTPQAQSDHPDIVAMAARITKDQPNALDATRRVVRWVWATVAKRSGARGGATAVEVLENREGDCTEHAALTVALCRAAGVPARAVTGLVYLVDGKKRPVAGYHAWAEAWVGRWLPVDATIPETGTSARYARFGIDEPGEPDRIARFIGALSAKTRLQILAWKYFGRERVQAEPQEAEAVR